MARRHYGRELWNRMCSFVEQPDDLPTTQLGYWTAEKLFFVGHYLAIVTQAGSGLRRRFSTVNYLDAFCGNGVCTTSTDRRYPGSAVLAAGCERPFDNLILVDSDPNNIDALAQRLSRLQSHSNRVLITGDVNEFSQSVANAIPTNSLNIAFLDPFSLNLHFSTLQTLTSGRSVDLILLFPDAIDIVRNVNEYYYPKRSMKLDLALGIDFDWRARWDELTIRDGQHVRDFFSRLFIERLGTLGYPPDCTATTEIRGGSGPLYKLVFASEHPLALKFWNIACRDTLGGERGLFGV